MGNSGFRRWAAPQLVVVVAASGCLGLLWIWFAARDGVPRALDWPIHLCWIEGFSAALADGVIYPRWIDTANGGLGAPVFLYYPPLAFVLASGFKGLLGSSLAALKASLLLSQGLLFAGCVFWFRSRLDRSTALLLAALVVLSPVILIPSLLFTMPAAALSLAIAPWLLAGLDRCGEVTAARCLTLALLTAALLLAHLPTALSMLLPIAALLASQGRRESAGVAIIAMGVGALLAAPYWVTALLHLDLVHSEHLTSASYWQIGSNLLDPRGIAVGAAVPRFAASLQSAGWSVLLASLLLAWMLRRAEPSQASLAARAALAASLLLVALASVIAAPLYDAWPALAMMQFGWRWLPAALLMLVWAAACSLRALSAPVGAARSRVVALVSAALLLPAMLGAVQVWALDARAGHGRVSANEATPAARSCRVDPLEHRPLSLGSQWQRALRRDAPMLWAVRGRAHVSNEVVSTHRRAATVTLDAPATLQWSALAFPGWTLRANGSPLPLTTTALGNYEFKLPPGRHALELRFESQRLTAVGDRLGGVGLLGLLLLLGWRRRRPVAAASAQS